MTTPDLTADDCERAFHAALRAGDPKGVEACLVALALRDPHRAQDLLDITRVALRIADDATLRPTLLAALRGSTIDVPAVPAGMDARPVVGFTIHCSHCGKPHEGEFGPTTWRADSLADLGGYELDDWHVDVDGRRLVCLACRVGWCDGCGEEVWAWQEYRGDPRKALWHAGCPDDGNDCAHPWHSTSMPDGGPNDGTCPACGDHAYPQEEQ